MGTFYIASQSTHNKQQAGIIIICTEERGKSYDWFQKNANFGKNGVVPHSSSPPLGNRKLCIAKPYLVVCNDVLAMYWRL